MITPVSGGDTRPKQSSSNPQSSEYPDAQTPVTAKPIASSSSIEPSTQPTFPSSELRHRSDRKDKKYYYEDDAIPKTPLSDMMPVKPVNKKTRVKGPLSIFGQSVTTGARTQANYRRRLNPSLIRRIRTCTFMHYVSHVVTFITILFFTFTWLLHYHVIPAIEARLTPEAQILVKDLLNRRAFEECNFVGWLNTPVVNLTYDTSRCSSHLGFSNVVIMYYESANASQCIPRTEIYPCASDDVMNDTRIAWDLAYYDYTTFPCPGGDRLKHNDRPVRFVTLDDNRQTELEGRLVPGVLFMFDCPRCVAATGVIRTWEDKCFQGVAQLTPSSPLSAVFCASVVAAPCDLTKAGQLSTALKWTNSINFFDLYISEGEDEEYVSDEDRKVTGVFNEG